MKKTIPVILVLLVSAIAAFTFAACSKDRAAEADVRITRAVSGLTFPQELKDGSKLVGVDYGDKRLSFRIEVEKAAFKAIDNDKTRANTLERLRTGLFPRNLIENVIAAGAGVRYVYICGEDSIEYSYSPDELK